MASKALKYVGIGCGVFVLIGVVAMVAGGMWVKSKMGGMAEWGEQVEKQSQEVAALNRQFAFQPPEEGKPLLLKEDRLKRYLAVRQQLEPVLAKYQAEAKKLEKKEGEKASVSDGLAAFGVMGGLMVELRGAYLAELRKQEMSPREFEATSLAVYTNAMAAATGGEYAEAHATNTQLLETYKDEIAKHESIGLDALLAGDDDESGN